jgi:hypothetical protein
LKRILVSGLIILSLFWFAHLVFIFTGKTLLDPTCSDDNRILSEDYWIKVRVDPTIELFCTIHRLAKTGQDDTHELPNYIRDIENYFVPFQNHRAVNLAKKLWETHKINISALSTLVVYLGDPPGLIPRNKLDPLPAELDSRWTVDVIPEFIEAAREFSRDSDYMVFFDSQKQLFNCSIMNLHESLDDKNLVEWFENYFSYMPDNYTIIVGMQTGFGNYGASITRMDGTNDFYSIIGAHSPFFWNGIPRFSSSRVIPIVVHEFCHPYINPLVAQHRERLRESGEELYSYNKAKLGGIGCLAWNHMMNEYIVRACVIRYLYGKGDSEGVERQIHGDENQGFTGIRALADLFEEYENNRDKYPNMDSFIPRIAIYLEQYVASFDEGT